MARRLVADRALADDVAQTVFILLAQKAQSLRRETVLSSWLFTVTRYASSAARREQARRRKHEKEAAAMREQASMPPDEPQWEQLAPILDELVARLRSSDRQAVLLRFYEQKTFPEIGTTLLISEEAARKRVSRAIEQLRGLFARKGVTMGATTLAAAMAANVAGTAGAAGLSFAVGSTLAVQSGTTAAIVKGASTMMFWAALKPAAMVLAAIVFTTAVGTTVMQLQARGGSAPVAAAPKAADAMNREEAGKFVPASEGIAQAAAEIGLTKFNPERVKATRETLDAESFPFFGESLAGKTTWVIEFNDIELPMQTGPDNFESNPFVRAIEVVLAPESGHVLTVTSKWPEGVPPMLPPPPSSEFTRQLLAERARYVALPTTAPGVTLTRALTASAYWRKDAKQFIAHYVILNRTAYGERSLWVIQVRGFPPYPSDGGPGGRRGEVSGFRDHYTSDIDAETGKWLGGGSVPQIVIPGSPEEAGASRSRSTTLRSATRGTGR
jgi:RNA polymerase sigma factor (sigma-70 family)